ncbi:MAG: hypothetical protein H7Y09_11450 [Chitinophagaceae bacterium]|nr:hypothetical protein [Anaerolineae bacterium]
MEETALLGFIGAVIGAGVTNFIAARLADKERKEIRRKERVTFLTNAMQSLVDLRGQYEAILSNFALEGHPSPNFLVEHYKIMGMAISVVLSIDDDELREIAIKRLTPHLVKKDDNLEEFRLYGEYPTRNRDALTDVVIQVGKLIAEEMKT